jgi:hypothetical protein
LQRQLTQVRQVARHPMGIRGKRQHSRFVQGIPTIQPGPPGQRVHFGELPPSKSGPGDPPGQGGR